MQNLSTSSPHLLAFRGSNTFRVFLAIIFVVGLALGSLLYGHVLRSEVVLYLHPNIPLLALGIFLPFLFFLTRGKGNYSVVIVPALAVAFSLGISYVTCKFFLNQGGSIPPVDQVIGNASYRGVEKQAQFRAFWAMIVTSALWTFATAFCWKRWMRPDNESTEKAQTKKFSRLIFFIFIFAFAVAKFPPFDWYRLGVPVRSLNFDSQNHLAWSYFRYLGLVPFRDFWYPYTGFYYSQLPSFPDNVLIWAHRVVTAGITAAGIYYLVNYSRLRSLIILLFLLVLSQLNLLKNMQRYLMAVSVVVLCAYCLRSRKRLVYSAAGLYLSYVYFMELNQLMYAAPGVLVLIAYEAYMARREGTLASLLACLGFTALFSLVPIGGYLCYLASTGAFPEYLLFYQKMGDLALYAMLPTSLETWFKSPWQPEGFLFLLVLSLFSTSLWHFIVKGDQEREIGDLVPFALSLVAIMAFQKQLVRPHVADQLIILPATGFAILAARAHYCPIRWGSPLRVFLAVATGILFGLFAVGSGAAASLVQGYAKTVGRLPQKLSGLVAKPAEREKAMGGLFAPETISVGGVSGDDIRRELMARMKLEKKDDLFVLGDDSSLYILLQQELPFYVSFYDQSIIHCQEHTVRWLDQHKPRYVVWNSSFREYDEVPNVVRVPLIFRHVMENYVYEDRWGPYLILRRGRPDHPDVLAFWRENCGDTVALGFIPSRSEAAKFAAGEEGGGKRFSVMTLRIPQPVQGREREIVFSIDGKPYRVTFRERHGVTAYTIVLDRIWFLQLARVLGLRPFVESKDLAGLWQMNTVGLSRNVLY